MTSITQNTPRVKPLSQTTVPYACLQLVTSDEADELGTEVQAHHPSGLVQVNFGGLTLGAISETKSGLRWLEWLAFDGLISEDALWAWFPGDAEPTRISDRDADKQARLWISAIKKNARFERAPQVMALYGDFGERVTKFASHPIIQARLAKMHEDAFTDELQGSDFSVQGSYLTREQHVHAESQFLDGHTPTQGFTYKGRYIAARDQPDSRVNRQAWADELTPLSPLFSPHAPRPRSAKAADEVQAFRMGIDFIERLTLIGNAHQVTECLANVEHTREVGGQVDLEACIVDIKAALTEARGYGPKWLDCVPSKLRDELASQVSDARARLDLPELDSRLLLISDLLSEQPDALACVPTRLLTLARKAGIPAPRASRSQALSFAYSTIVSTLVLACEEHTPVTWTPRDLGRGVRKASGKRYPQAGRTLADRLGLLARPIAPGKRVSREYTGSAMHCQRIGDRVLVTAS